MIKHRLSALFKQVIHGDDVYVHGLAIDSRKVKAGEVFLAFKGEQDDGHRYIDQAISNGAIAIVLEDDTFIAGQAISYVVVSDLRQKVAAIAAEFYGKPSEFLQVIGITGTNGKTSISHYIEQLLALSAKPCAVIGTLGVRYQQKHIASNNTTPDAVTLQQQFYAIKQANIQYVAMEVSSHALVQGRCNNMVFEGAVFSNLSQDHLDYHQTMDDYFAAKKSLFTQAGLRWVVLNKDDARFAELQQSIASTVRIISYSIDDATADIYLKKLRYVGGAYQAVLIAFSESYTLTSRLQGAFNLSNLLAAIAAVAATGVPIEELLAHSSKIQAVAGRMQSVSNKKNINAIVDYAHTPDALENVLANIKPLTTGKLLLVFGCGGDRDRSKRPLMAKAAEQYADTIIVTDDNPRTENSEQIHADICAGFTKQNHQVIADREKAILFAAEQAKAGDSLVVAGKGHENYQVVGTIKHPFNDVAVLQEALC